MTDARVAMWPQVLPSETVRTQTAFGTAFVTLTRDEHAQPFEVFLSVGKAGSETLASAEALGRLVSLILRIESPIPRHDRAREIAAHLDGIGSRTSAAGRPSMPDALARILLNLIGDARSAQESSQPTPHPVRAEADLQNPDPMPLPNDLRGEGNQQRRTKSAMSMTLPPTILAAAEQLAKAIEAAEPVATYRRAKAHLDDDAHAHELLERLSAAQADLRRRQNDGGVTPAALEQVRALQREVQSTAIIMEFAMAQQEAVAYLPQVNLEISEMLGVDFASLAGPGSC